MEDEIITTVQPNRSQLSLYQPQDWRSRLKRFWQKQLHFLEKRDQQLELISFWRTQSSSFALSFSILINLGLVAYVSLNFSKLPPQVPFFLNEVSNAAALADKSFLILAPIIILGIELVIIRFSYLLYDFDQRLGQSANWTITVINIINLLAFWQILSIIT